MMQTNRQTQSSLLGIHQDKITLDEMYCNEMEYKNKHIKYNICMTIKLILEEE